MQGVRILLTGISGFAGSALLPRLLERATTCARWHATATRVERRSTSMSLQSDVAAIGLADFELVIGDTLSGAGMVQAMRGVEVAYYLIHSMEPSQRRTATRSPRASGHRRRPSPTPRARRACERIVYLGGPLPRRAGIDSPLEPLRGRAHPARRGSRFGRAARLDRDRRALALLSLSRATGRAPAGTRATCLAALSHAVRSTSATSSRCSRPVLPTEMSPDGRLRSPAPRCSLTARWCERIAELMMLLASQRGLGVSVTPIAARLAAVLTDEQPELVLPLMEGLTGDLLPDGEEAADGPECGIALIRLGRRTRAIRVGKARATRCPLIAHVSHPALNSCASYGWPRDEHRFRLDRDRRHAGDGVGNRHGP